jgi:hypothetical protein
MSTIETGRPIPINPPGAIQEYEVELHYEQKLRTLFFESANEDGTIKDETEWDCMIAMFMKARVVSLEDTRRLEKVRPSFPIEFGALL